MRTSWTDRRWNPLVAVCILLLLWACGDGGDGCDDVDCGGCGCDDDGGPAEDAYVFPDDGPIVPQGVQVRVTRSGLDFIENNFDTIVGLLLDDEGEGGITFCLPREGAVGFTICPNPGTCSDGGEGCDVDILLEDLSISPRNPASAAESGRIEVELEVSTSNIPWRPLIGTCFARLENMPITAVVTFNVDAPPHERIHINIPTDELDFEIRTRYLNLNAGGGIGCAIVGGLAGFFVNLLSGTIGGLLVDPITEAVEGFTCVTCSDTNPCPEGSSCDEGICRVNGTDTCVQADLGLEMAFNLGGLLGDVSPGLDAHLGILAYLAGYADTADGGGIDLSAQTGFHADPDLCVPYRDPPSTSRVMKSSELHGEQSPLGNPFSVGIGLSKSSADLALWGVYSSGALCLSIGADTVDQLTTSLFAALIDSLNQVTLNRNLPLLLQLAPNQPPYVEFGAGTIDRSGSNPVILEPLIELTLPDLDIHFHTWIHDRWVRLFTLNVDFALPLGLDVDGNAIVPVIGDLENALPRIEARNGELLLQADLDSLVGLLPGLIAGLAGPLLGDLTDGFELPDLAGFELILSEDSFTGIEDNTMLGVFAELALASGSYRMPLLTELRHAQVDVPTTADILAEVDRARTADRAFDARTLQPTVIMDVAGVRADGSAVDEIEAAWRINGSYWSFWHHTLPLSIEDPRLRLEGRHLVEVRTRFAGDLMGASTNTVSALVVVDRTPPQVHVDATDGLVRVNATDNLHEERELTMRVATDGDAFGPWGPIDDLRVRPDASTIRVEVADPAGNVAAAETTMKRAAPAVAPVDPVAEPVGQAPRAGCSAAPGHSGALPALLLLTGLLALRVRRRRLLALFAAALLLAACGKSGKSNIGDESSSDDTFECDEETPCEEGFNCEAGACVEAGEPCTDTSDCGRGEVCIDGECRAVACDDASSCNGISCPAGQDAYCGDNGCYCGGCDETCPEDRYCCASQNRCFQLPDPCADHSCPVGQRTEPVQWSTGDSGRCTIIDPGECTCVELDPLTLGQYGFHLDAAVAPDGSYVALSTRNRTYRDLMIGWFEGDEITWEFVDGIPADGDVTGNLAGPRGGISTQGPDVGEHSSLTIDASGALHVAYAVNGVEDRPAFLRYARGTGTALDREWTFIDLETTAFTGRYTHTLLDPDGHPAILYSAVRFRDDDTGEWFSELRMARATTATPDSAEDFDITVIERAQHVEPCGGSCQFPNQRCRLDTLTCEVNLPARRCDPECGGEEACFDGDPDNTCIPVAQFPGYDTPTLATGMFPTGAWLSDGTFVASWYDGIHGNLMFLRQPPAGDDNGEDSGTAAAALVLDGETVNGEGEVIDLGDVGRFARLFVDSEENIYIAYVDSTMAELRVYDVSGDAISTVDDGVRINGNDVTISRVGEDPYILEVNGRLIVAYQDPSEHAVLESRLEGEGWTEPSIVRARFNGDNYVGAPGFFARHVDTGFGRFVLHHRMDMRASPVVRDVVASPR